MLWVSLAPGVLGSPQGAATAAGFNWKLINTQQEGGLRGLPVLPVPPPSTKQGAAPARRARTGHEAGEAASGSSGNCWAAVQGWKHPNGAVPSPTLHPASPAQSPLYPPQFEGGSPVCGAPPKRPSAACGHPKAPKEGFFLPVTPQTLNPKPTALSGRLTAPGCRHQAAAVRNIGVYWWHQVTACAQTPSVCSFKLFFFFPFSSQDSTGLPSATAQRTAAAGGTEPSSWMRPAEMGTIGTAARGPRRLPSAPIRLKMHRASPQKWDRGCNDATAERGVEREPPASSGGTTGQNAAGLC